MWIKLPSTRQSVQESSRVSENDDDDDDDDDDDFAEIGSDSREVNVDYMNCYTE
jgi:hypothetical protein